MNINPIDTNATHTHKPSLGKSQDGISRIISNESFDGFRKESAAENVEHSDLSLNPIEFFNKFTVDRKDDIKSLESISKKPRHELQAKIDSKLHKLKNKFTDDSNIFDYLKQHKKITARINTAKKPETSFEKDDYYELLAEYVLYKLESDEAKKHHSKIPPHMATVEATPKPQSQNEKDIDNVIKKVDRYISLKLALEMVDLNQSKHSLEVSKLKAELKELKEDISQNMIFDAKVIRKYREARLVDY